MSSRAIVMCVLVVLLGVGWAIYPEVRDAKFQGAVQAPVTSGNVSPLLRRVLYEDLPADDVTRASLFRDMASAGSWRCDAVTSALMRAPGFWTVSCSPGYVYAFGFDKDGKLIQIERSR